MEAAENFGHTIGILIGYFGWYSVAHLIVMSHWINYKQRGGYEQFVSWYAYIWLAFVLLLFLFK